MQRPKVARSESARAARGDLGTRLLCTALLIGGAGCLAPPPPIVVETPFGDVRASSVATAEDVANLLEGLAPRVRELLPGSQDRSIDVWVQEELRVHRFNKRPESVRGFTLLTDEFEARRIHLQEAGQSPWYLGHELVHALIGKDWAPLPGILEEGLADTIAERLAPRYRVSIRAHRLLNASAFTDGILLRIAYDDPFSLARLRERKERWIRLQLAPSVPPEMAWNLLGQSRSELHDTWPEIPESFYGLSWLIASRIVERRGVEGLHALCLRATAEKLDVMPKEWILQAAEVDLDAFESGFMASCFGRQELQQAAYLRPDAFAQAAAEALRPLHGKLDSSELFALARPHFLLADGSRIPLSAIDPMREALRRIWRRPSP